MRKIIDRVRARGLKLGILSDTVEPHMRENQAKGVYDGFDAVSLSPQIKSTKMSEAAFRIAALRLWLPPQACIFIDDRKAYADRASHIGMKSIHFESPQQLEMALKENSLPARISVPSVLLAMKG
jgi:HAD superfamily hydrolase (TIGR01509 family)